ncbi:pirin-like protein [Morus notabilis]|nr:pirin-like protein [Morus notabilis]
MRAITQKLLFYNTKLPKVPFLIRNTMSEPDQSPAFNRPRLVAKKVLAKLQHEGDGAVVRRGIGRSDLKNLDPFLMLDDFSVSPPAGFPDHPHRGFETVTYMLQGAITHQDFAGHKGTIRTGDVQWMTAGRGIIHSEMPAGEGPQTGLQLWINLSSKDKMIEPRYQELSSDEIPSTERDGVEVRVIAGESMGIRSPVYTRTPTMYLDFALKPRAQIHQSIPESWNSFVYVIEGEGVFGSLNSSPVSAHHVLVLGPGDGLSVWNKSSKPLRFVLVGGLPLNEPVVQHGPFVMNTQAEIDQTIQDYYYSQNGFEMAKYWRSQ